MVRCGNSLILLHLCVSLGYLLALLRKPLKSLCFRPVCVQTIPHLILCVWHYVLDICHALHAACYLVALRILWCLVIWFRSVHSGHRHASGV